MTTFDLGSAPSARYEGRQPRGLSRYEMTLTGDIDLATTPQLDEHVRLCALRVSHEAVVDLSEVTFFGSTGLSFLVRLRQALAARDGSVTVYCTPWIARLLRLEGFEPTFTLVLPQADRLQVNSPEPWGHPGTRGISVA